MKAVIPMAGYGKRLRPHTFSRPKPLINVAGQPMLKYLIDALEAELDIDEYIFIVGYLGEQIKEWIDENYDFKATYVVQDELIGQADAIYRAREHIDGPTIILFSDTLFETDLDVVNRTDADAVIYAREVEDPRRFGVVELNEEGRITRFIEKPDTTENKNAVIGLYYVREGKDLIAAIEEQMARNEMTKGEFYLADAFQIMIDDGADFRSEPVDVWLDCGKPETVLETNRYLLENGYDNSSTVQIEGVTVIAPSNVHPSAHLENVIVGPYATIGKGCDVRSSIIQNSVVDDGATVQHMVLSASLIGRNANVVGRHYTLNVGDSSAIDFGEC